MVVAAGGSDSSNSLRPVRNPHRTLPPPHMVSRHPFRRPSPVGKPRARSLLACVLILLAATWFVQKAIPEVIVSVGDRIFSAQNRYPDPAVSPPEQPERSGSAQSVVHFDGLGFYGSRFLNGGASARELTAATGEPAKEPIRVYAGLGNTLDGHVGAQLLIEELERTNAKDRKALLFLMTTGTGWVSSYATQGFELLYHSDTAIAAGQYSAMPSALHFLAGGNQVKEASRELLTPLINWWNDLPTNNRPKLYLYGKSLGSTGMEAAFSGLRDIRRDSAHRCTSLQPPTHPICGAQRFWVNRD